jgi:glycosyltransferase involved in cell wall biosynthesis
MVARPHRTHRRRRLVEVAQTLAVVGDHADLIWVAATTEAQAFLPLAATGRLAVAVDDRPAPAAAPLLGAASRVLAATPDLAARAAALAPRGDVEIATPSPVDGNLEVPAQPRRLALVAPWDWESGIDDALRAVAALRRSGRDTRLDLAGCGPAEEQIRYTVRDLGLSEAVRLRGPAAAERIVAGADAAVLPALTDRPWPEAVAVARSGRPLIVTDLPWLRRAVPVATFIPPRDPEALTDALDQRADDPPNP